MNRQKKIAAINDISCIGKCSLTVALPILSCAGFEACPVPTAVLSTHTGDFTGFTFHDLTNQLQPIANHWKTLDLSFDAVYSGYLGSFSQLDFAANFIDSYKQNAVILVDPVMGDHGRLYSGFDKSFAKGMTRLCKKADIIVPNITEACYMTDTEYMEEVHTVEYIEGLLQKLSLITDGDIVLTGVSLCEGQIGAACMHKGEISYVSSEKLEVAFHGTGDVFASVLLAALMRDFPLDKATKTAVDFVVLCIKKTAELVGNKHYGVNFELCMRELLNMLDI